MHVKLTYMGSSEEDIPGMDFPQEDPEGASLPNDIDDIFTREELIELGLPLEGFQMQKPSSKSLFRNDLFHEVPGDSQLWVASETVTAQSVFVSAASIVPVPSEMTTAPSTVSASSVVPISYQRMQDHTPVVMVEFPGNRAPVPLLGAEILAQVQDIAATMIGRGNYHQMNKSGSCLLGELLSSLPASLEDLQEKVKKDIRATLSLLEEETSIEDKLEKIYFPLSLKLKRTGLAFLPGLRSTLAESLQTLQEKNNRHVTLEEVKNEASKWIYLYIRRQDPKEKLTVVAHPQHIKNIPRDWRIEHPDCASSKRCYPPGPVYQSIADYTGLEIKQVHDLFQNDRKRRAKKDPELAPILKKHFTQEVTDKLREWKVLNPGKTQPDEASRDALMRATGLEKIQIIYWFGNNAPGRDKRNSNKKRRHPENPIME